MGENKAVDYPLMFTFRDVISGNGWLAGVTLSGRALMTNEDGWWMYGVRPGAIAETGETPQETFLRFRNTYKAVLFDMASDSANFDAFKKEAEQFYYQLDDDQERRWTEAVNNVRLSNIKPEPLFASLPKEPPETRPSQIAVERLDVTKRFAADDNIPDQFFSAAA